MELDLIKAVAGGGQLVVFVVVVVVFLKYVQTITTSFQSQVQSLTDSVFKFSADNSKALSELASAVRDLQGRLDDAHRDRVPPR